MFILSYRAPTRKADRREEKGLPHLAGQAARATLAEAARES
jgi:hypothetical protein